MRFGVLGSVEVIVDGGRYTVRRAQARGVLALLVLHSGRPVSSAAIEEALWAGAPPETARAQVHAAVSSIRALLSRSRVPDAVDSGRFGYRLQVPPDEVDVHLFDQLVGQARHQPDPVGAADLLRQALTLWRGEALADAAGAFVVPVRAELAERRLAAVEQLAEIELSLGRHVDVVAELAPLVAEHPFRERLRARLILALYRSGRQAEALRNFHQYRQMLAEHEGLDPGSELAELATAVLRDDPSLDLSDAAMNAPVAPGPAVLVPAQLPADVPDFTGRSDYLEALDRLTAGADTPAPPVLISAIDGMAGVGKTTLAVHWARGVRDRFADGQIYLNLRGHARIPALQPLEALAHLLYGLGVPAAEVPVDVDDAASLFRTLVADRRLLLLLDDASSAEQVRPLLPGGDRCLVLITSRQQLGGLVALEGGRRLTVKVLAPEESRALLASILGADRLDAEPAAAAELAMLCAHLPLALRIAAAHLADREPGGIGEYVAELQAGDRLVGLEIPGDAQAAVRAAFDLSERSLSAGARRLFRLVGLAPGTDLTAGAVAALAGQDGPQVSAGLSELVGKHLVSEAGAGRFTLHDLLRVYAAECAERDEDETVRTAARARLFDHYLHTAGAAAAVAYPQTVRLPPASTDGGSPVGSASDSTMDFTGAPAAMAWLEAERHNLVAAVRFAADQEPLRSYAWRLADVLRGYFWIRRYGTDWLSTAEAGLAAATTAGDRLGQAAAQLSLGVALRSLGRYPDAIARLEAALALAREVGWTEGEATGLGGLATVFAETGQFQRAVDHVSQSLVLSRAIGRVSSEAVQLGNRGNMRLLLGELEEAAADMTAALELYRKTGNRGGESVMLSGLGLVDMYRGGYATALEHAEHGLRVSREVGDRYGEAIAMGAVAQVHLAVNRPDLARPLAEDAVGLTREIGDQLSEAYALTVVGQARCALGDGPAAVDLYTEAVRLARANGNRHATVEALTGLAETHGALGAWDSAMGCATEALSIARRDGYQLYEGAALTVIAAAHLARGEPERAASVAQEALARHRATGYRRGRDDTETLLWAGAGDPSFKDCGPSPAAGRPSFLERALSER